ncbi:type I-E CRISPR-associated protein Cse1/CasA [Kitasatospora sp. cg17-2]
MTHSYDLLTEPWIGTWGPDGEYAEVGIREALERAHELFFPAAVPEDVAVLRLLVAVYGAAAGPVSDAEWDAAWAAPRLDADRIAAYLDRWRDRFDLYSPTHPFLQCAALVSTPRGAGALNIVSLTTGGGAFFEPRLARGEEEHPAWRPGAAARALLLRQGFDTAGIKAAVPGDPDVRGGKVYGAQRGPLWQTTHLGLETDGRLKDQLLLGWTPYRRPDADTPAWERPSPGPGHLRRLPEGRLDWLTWPTRRIRLAPDDAGDVVALALHEGDRLTEPVASTFGLDPMAAWRHRGPRKLPLNTLTSTCALVHSRLRGLYTAPGASGAVEHAMAAVRRGAIDPEAVLRATTVQAVASDKYGSVLGGIFLDQLPFGRARNLVDAEWCRGVAAYARRSARLHAQVYEHIAGAARVGTDVAAGMVVVPQPTEEWSALVLADGPDQETAGEEYLTVLADGVAQVVRGWSRSLRLPQRAVLEDAVDRVLREAVAPLEPEDLTPSAPADPPPAPKRSGRPAASHAAFGETLTLAALAAHPRCVVNLATLRRRIDGGMDPEEAATTASRKQARPADE